MAKSKQELLEQLEAMGVEVNPKSTVKALTELLAANQVTDEVIEDKTVAAAINDEVETTEEPEASEEPNLAKAGKRSAKAVAEAEEKQAKEERKASGQDAEAKPKAPVTPTRSRLERRAKGFRKSAEQLEKGKLYGLSAAVELAQKTSHVKFDATVELHINLGVDPRHADQNIRDNLVLPAGTGKTVIIAVLTEDAAAAKQAGADIAGTDDLFAELDKGNMDFDVLIATPTLMSKLGKYARVLGPRGLMPNPKSGTVTSDVNKAVSEAKAGRVEYRVDSAGIVHLGIGKVSFTPAQLQQNAEAVFASIKANKPQNLKANYVKAIYMTTSMGPSIAVDLGAIN